MAELYPGGNPAASPFVVMGVSRGNLPMGISLAALACGLVAVGMGIVLLAGPDEVRIDARGTGDQTQLANDATVVAPTPEDPGVPAVRVIGDQPLPAEALLFTTTGGYRHGTGLPWQVRVIRGGDDPVVTDVSIPGADSGTVMGVVADARGVLYTGVCSGANCGTEGEVTGGATTFFWSMDGGASWVRVNERAGRWWLRLAVDGDAVAVNFDGASPAAVYVTSNAAIDRAEAWDGLVTYREEPAWISGEFPMLVDERGGSLLKLDVPGDAKVTEFWEDASPGEQWAALWRTDTPNPASHGFDSRYFLTVTAASAPRSRTFETKNAIVRVVARWDSDVLLVEAEVSARPTTCKQEYAAEGDHGISPALFNTVTGDLSFFADPFFPEGCAEGAEQVVKVWRGDFRSVNTPGDCLNLRERPAPDATVITCVVDRAYVNAVAGSVTEAGGIRWVRALTLSGQDGWMAEEFLRR